MRSFGLLQNLATTAAVVGATLVPVAAAPAVAVATAADCGFSVVSSPNASKLRNSLNAVTVAVSSDDVWAVGEGDPWHWNGAAWSVPDLGAQLSRGVAATGSVNVWAAGSYTGGSPVEGVTGPFPRGERWTGRAWQSSAASALGIGEFYGVTARSGSDVVAVGRSKLLTLAARWTGSGWQRVASGNGNTSPQPNRAYGNVLFGVDSAPDGSTWAVGYSFRSGYSTPQQTLIERYSC